MHVLVINSGSSSIKFSMFDAAAGSMPVEMYDGELSGIGAEVEYRFEDAQGKDLSNGRRVEAKTVDDAIRTVAEITSDANLPRVEAVGYRVVHPGPKLKGHQRITPEVLQALREARAFAPLHDPVAVEMIEDMMQQFPVAHYACFDTVFHETMTEVAKTYAIPKTYRDQGVRRYGFHGLSCESAVIRMREQGELPKRMVIAHLGSGCSVTAVVNGTSVNTTMGLTPTGGVVMGTRPGDLDPGLMLYLLRQQEGDMAENLETMLNHNSGMVALSGLANDMKAVRKAAADGHAAARLAIDIFVQTVRQAIGGFAFLMGGLDAVVFTGGIGEHDAATRTEVLRGLEGMGIRVDTEKNTANMQGLTRVSADGVGVGVYVVPAEEDRIIALHVGEMAL